MDLLQGFHKNMILFSVGRFFCRGMSIDKDYHLWGSGQHQPVYHSHFWLFLPNRFFKFLFIKDHLTLPDCFT